MSNGFLLTPSLVLTSAHNFFGEDKNGEINQLNLSDFKFKMSKTKSFFSQSEFLERSILEYRINRKY
jgi:hypothetical protein